MATSALTRCPLKAVLPSLRSDANQSSATKVHLANANPVSRRLLAKPAFSTFQKLPCNQTYSRPAQASPNHIRKGPLGVRAAQRGTAQEGEKSVGKPEVAEVNVRTCLIHFPTDLTADVMTKKLEAAYGPGSLIRTSDCRIFSGDDRVYAGSYVYIHDKNAFSVETEDMKLRIKILSDLEEIKRNMQRRRRRRWFYF